MKNGADYLCRQKPGTGCVILFKITSIINIVTAEYFWCHLVHRRNKLHHPLPDQ